MSAKKNAPGRCRHSAEGIETVHHLRGSSVSDHIRLPLLTVLALLADIAATIEEILDNCGYTLTAAMHAAALAGLDPEDYRKVPLIEAGAVAEIRRRILTERAELTHIESTPADEPIPYRLADELAPRPRSRSESLALLGPLDGHFETLHRYRPHWITPEKRDLTVELARYDCRDKFGSADPAEYHISLQLGHTDIPVPLSSLPALIAQLCDAVRLAGLHEARDAVSVMTPNDILEESRRRGQPIGEVATEIAAAFEAEIAAAVA